VYDQETRDDSLNSQSLARGSQNYESDEQYQQLMNNYKKETSGHQMVNNSKKFNDENQPFEHSGKTNNTRDEKPIKSIDQNFDEFVEQSMKEEQSTKSKAKIVPKQKQFLKRSQKSTLPNQSKQYNYYASNFEQKDQELVQVNCKQKIIEKQEYEHTGDLENDSVEEFEKLEEECINATIPKQQKTHSAMQMIDQKANAQKPKKRKLFDDSESEQSDSDQEDVEKLVKQESKGGKSNVVKRMIYNEQEKPVVKKEAKDQIPVEIEQIMHIRANEHNIVVKKYKKEYEA
jgi:hypothetical protein